MRSGSMENLLLYSESPDDGERIRTVAQTVYADYAGNASQWRPPNSDQMWGISLGGRAGVLGVRLGKRTVCVKLYYDERLRTRLRTRLGCSKGRRAYRNGVRLRATGIACPRMLGYAEQRPSGPAMIVTELIEDGMRLDHWIAKYGVGKNLPAGLARFVRNMHDRGVTHVDLSPRNIMVRMRDDGYEFLLLDYEDARFLHNVDRRTRCRDLNHLHERLAVHTSLRDRLRFLRVYAPQDYTLYREQLHRMLDKSTSRYLQPHI
ncbi:MAG TPA: lipopolysaccharide kinase InaA family protein [Sedimentisphaerales bacterium]|jgi:tRNA A-37 threonylcarbamoyl transferase component Bud32|nr:lipopolysaccharide kinase InaA family protein [Sedimentisphaerales bacterium]HNU29615.1 lipopolysaccharide kinase InaA family protein [Sedimentisphaerales bacterium]